ncbi:MAG: protein kinase, partial [Terriglobia bacterium]|nr:protein kinase [Terriglobia bacterium]
MGLSAGTRLGPYEIVSPLGAGGMGEVYCARDTRLDRTVAVKVLPSNLSDNPDLKQRFEREAKVISSLNHPHVCTLFDVGEHEGIVYLVMEHLEGETLADRLIRGPLKINEALELASDIAEALDKAHHAGIIHRDLKPANIMLTRSGAKLMDFGLAKPALALATGATGAISPSTPTMSLQALSAPASPLTQKGAIVGTFQYMAPEVLQGAEADARSDIFSFGCVLYEMVTGRRAFEGKSQLSVATAILEKEIEPITSENPNVPPVLAQIISTCLAKNPDERFACSHDVNLQLRSVPIRATNNIGSVNRTREMLLLAALTILVFAAGWLGYERWRDAHKAVQVVQSELDIYAADVVDRASGGQVSEQFALSPDGRDLAYVARKPGASGTQLWIRHLNSGASTALPGTEEARSPFWSPDSRAIGFFSFGRLKTIVLSTQTVTDLCQARFYWGTWGSRGT